MERIDENGAKGRQPRRPLLPALGALALGAVLAQLEHGGLALGLAAAAGALGLAGLVRARGENASAGRLALLLPLGALLAAGALRAPHPAADGAGAAQGRWRAAATGGPGELHGPGGWRARFELEPGLARDGEELLVLPGRAPPTPARGPVARTGRPPVARLVASDELVRLAPASAGPAARVRELASAARARILARVHELHAPVTRGLAGALLVGEREHLPTELPDLFTRTGLAHALAISGMQVGLVAAMLLWPAGAALARAWRLLAPGPLRNWRLGEPAPWRAALLALFAPIAGGGAPVVRAALALALSQLAPRRPDGAPRGIDALSLWACAALVELSFSPHSITSASLALSYLATLGLIVATAPMRALTLRLFAWEPARTTRLGRPWPELARVLRVRLARFTLAAVALSLAASLATLPLVWVLWGEWSPVGWIATPLLLPLMSLFMALGWPYALLPFDLPGLEAALDALAAGMVGLLALADRLPGTPASLPPRPAAWLAVLGVAAVALCTARRGALARAVAALAGLTLLPWTLAPARLEFHALDVGHGTAGVLRAPGSPCWIFDAGSRDRPGVAREALAPMLRALEVGEVGIVLSHGHRDHAGALGWLVERFPPTTWLGAPPARPGERVPHGAQWADVGPGVLSWTGARTAGPSLELELARGLDEAGNEGSRVLVASWGNELLILCGDAEERGLEAMLAAGALDGPCELLLLPHHGSDTALLGSLLARARPANAWVSSTGRPPVAAELERRAIPWRSPALHGPLSYAGPGTLSETRRPPSDGTPNSARPGPAGPVGRFFHSGKDLHPRKEPDMSKHTRAFALPRLASLLALAAATQTLPASAAPSPQGDEVTAVGADERASERQRVLHLEDGTLVRGKARWVADPSDPAAGRWEVREGAAWRALAAGEVMSWRDLSELQKEARARRDALGRTDHDQRAALAEWMLSEGLEAEAITELERVLRAAPDHDGALAVIQRGSFDLSEFGDPHANPAGAIRAALAAGESRNAVRRELAVRVLREVGEREALQDVLRQSLSAFRQRERYFATLALRRLMPGTELHQLLRMCGYDPSAEVRAGAAHALRDTGKVGVILPLVRALGSSDGMLRIRAAESLGNIGHEAAVPALVTAMTNVAAQGTSNLRPPGGNLYVGSEVTYVGDYDIEIAQAASIADPIVMSVHSGVVLEARAHGFLEYTKVTEYQTIRQSLKTLTGHDAGSNPDKWAAWYEANRAQFETGGAPAGASGAPRSDG